jgi:flagellar motor switch protein FliM
MADALTQKDIDALLKKGEAASPKKRKAVDVIPYNFLRPPRVSRDRQATLETIYNRFALALQGMLSTRLRAGTDVVVSSVEQATFAEFQFSLANPCAAFVFEMHEDSAEYAVMDMGTDMAFYLVDRLFGGPGDSVNMNRAITPLERLVIQGIAEKTLGLLADVWKDSYEFEPTNVTFESVPDALQVASKEDNVLVANLEVKSGSFAGWLSVCIPLNSLEGFLQEKPARSMQARFRGGSDDREKFRGEVESTLRLAKVPISARFPVFNVKSTDLAMLKPGDVVMTGHTLNVPVDVHVRGREYVRGEIGQAHGHIGLRVTEVLDKTAGTTKPRIPKGKLL